jgi:hypothetical protein
MSDRTRPPKLSLDLAMVCDFIKIKICKERGNLFRIMPCVCKRNKTLMARFNKSRHIIIPVGVNVLRVDLHSVVEIGNQLHACISI